MLKVSYTFGNYEILGLRQDHRLNAISNSRFFASRFIKTNSIKMNTFYRKMAFLISGIVYLCGVLFFMRCRPNCSVELLLIGRLLVGIASGLSTSTAPMYLAEISPPSLRGAFGTFFSVGLTAGIVIGQIFSLEEILGNDNNWQYAFSAFGFFNLVPILIYHCIPESPKYLYVIAGRERDARMGIFKLII